MGGATVAVQQTDVYNATAGQTAFTASATPVTSSTIYVVAGGVLLGTADFSVSGTTLTLGTGVPVDTIVTWAYWTTLTNAGTQTIESFTAASDGETDFTLAHTPISGGIVLVAPNGVIQAIPNWSLIAPATVRLASPGVLTGEIVTVSYRY